MVKVGVVGATGYTGAEIVRLLASHPRVELTSLTAKVEGSPRVDELFPSLRGHLDLPVTELPAEEVAERCDLVFLALPHRVSMQYVPHFLGSGRRVIDLSADYRLRDAALYERWYGARHVHQEGLKEAVFGVSELFREKIKKARLLANPGCYSTGVILSLAPLAAEGKLSGASVIVDAKSGVSGAGRWPGDSFFYAELNENFKAYKIGRHQHVPEMEMVLGELSGGQVKVLFSPHLLPISRGILNTIYVRPGGKVEAEALPELYRRFFEGSPFVHICNFGELPQIRDVRWTNNCRIGFAADPGGGHLIMVSAIDNLMKGASGQAVQNMNLMLGFEETEGLPKTVPII